MGKTGILMHFYPSATCESNGWQFHNCLSFPVDKAAQAFPRRSHICLYPPPPLTRTLLPLIQNLYLPLTNVQ